MGLPQQIKTVNATKIQPTDYPGGSRNNYECANPFITRGVTGQPSSLDECLNSELYGEKVSSIVNKLGGFNSWSGPDPLSGFPDKIESTFIGIESSESLSVKNILGEDYTGCYWAAPDASFSCDCPSVGSKYADYLKLRLNVATFWNTRPEAPILRKKFLDSINYGSKVTFTIAGDFRIRPGSIVEVYADAISGYSTSLLNSSLNKKYYVISVKNTVTNSGVHETTIVGVDPVL